MKIVRQKGNAPQWNPPSKGGRTRAAVVERPRAVTMMDAAWCRTARSQSRVQSDLRGCRQPPWWV